MTHPVGTERKAQQPARLLWSVALALLALLAVIGPYKMLRGTPKATGGGLVVTMAPKTFAPATLTVPKGTTVVFENNDVAPHTVTTDDGTIDSGTIRPGENFSLLIDRPFSYFCAIHPSMKAAIAIEA